MLPIEDKASGIRRNDRTDENQQEKKEDDDEDGEVEEEEEEPLDVRWSSGSCWARTKEG